MQAVTSARFSFLGYTFLIECLEVVYLAWNLLAEVLVDFVDRSGGTSKIVLLQIP